MTPIVFLSGDDPSITSLSLVSRGQTATSRVSASSQPKLMPKRFELLSELVPQARVIALLVYPSRPSTERMIRDVQDAARAKGSELHILKAGTEGEIDAAFATLVPLQ